MKIMRNFKIVILIFLLSCIHVAVFAQISREFIQELFPAGKFVTFKDNVACFQLNNLDNGRKYGYCKFDNNYKSDLMLRMTSWEKGNKQAYKILNTPCYTIIAPIYDQTQPFNEGWAPVCINKKWSYVSENGDYLCGFVLDSASPFKKGEAKVRYEGKKYTIDLNGNGLPESAYNSIDEIRLDLLAKTINQLYHESQYQEAVYRGKEIYGYLTTSEQGRLPELSATSLTHAIQIVFATMSAQNDIMALSMSKFKNVFNKYRSLPIQRCVSFESRHPSLNLHNAQSYFNTFKSNYAIDCSDIITEIERYDYKSAILKFEKWVRNSNVSLNDDFILSMTYYYLAELSDDFETANKLLIKIAEKYEDKRTDLTINDNMLGVLLADIKRYQSAESVLNRLMVNPNNKREELFCLYYNLALMYKSAHEDQKSQEFFCKALQIEAPNVVTDVRLECMSEFLHSQLASGIVDKALLQEYVSTEIDYNICIFETNNSLVINRLWGNSLQRMNRVIEYLGRISDPTFLQCAYALSVFQQGITFDADRNLTKAVTDLDNPLINSQYKSFLTQKSNL